jgi:hypothetical protein
MPDKSTQPRLDVTKVSPDLFKAMASLEKYVEASGLAQKLLDLVKNPCLADQRVRLLYRHAHQRCTQAW